MFPPFELHHNEFTISTDPGRLDLDAICDMLSRAYWAKERPREMIARSLQYSLNFGLYDDSRHIGIIRVVSDYTTFAWLCDVFIHEDYRGQGLGKWLLETVHSHPELQGVSRWILATRDAHDFYKQFGWVSLAPPERWMMWING